MAELEHVSELLSKRHQPKNVNERHKASMSLLDRVGVTITRLVGTMIAALLFTLLALVSLPAAIKSHSVIILVAWIAQTFLQLVLLPIIMVGQNIQGQHTEIMADEEFKTTQTTYKDLEHLILVNQKQLDLLLELARKQQKNAGAVSTAKQ